MAFRCELCDYTTVKRFNFDKHLATRTHQRVQEISTRQPTTIPQTTQERQEVPETNQAEKVSNLTCKHCDKKFAFKQSLYRHIKNSCKNKGQELDEAQEPKEMLRLMKIEMEKLKTEMEKQMNEFQKQNERLDDQQRQIDHLMKFTFQPEHADKVKLHNDILEHINHVFDR
jgi:hypothetical protein